MKLVLVLTLSFPPLFAFLTNLPLAFSNNVEQVLDTNGNPIFSSGTYYIMPAMFGLPGGGLKLSKTGNSNCPTTVLQDYSEVFHGLPVKFNIPEISHGIIFTEFAFEVLSDFTLDNTSYAMTLMERGTPLDIEFNIDGPPCARSTKWWIFVDMKIEKAYVGIGGQEVHPGERMVNGTFNIQNYRFGYKLMFCVDDSPTCLDIGIYDMKKEMKYENGRRLKLTHQEPFKVVFVDASKVDGIIKSVV